MVRHEDGVVYYSTLDLIKKKLFSKKKFKEKMPVSNNHTPPPKGAKINYLAIILDGEVQEIMRAQNRLTALLLSEPKFVEFDPEETQPEIGWLYDEEKFIPGE
jgi:hypothetical protein